MKKEYFFSDTEFLSGAGQIYSEFIDGVATRQISSIGTHRFASSDITEWNDIIGFLLYDGKKEDLDLSSAKKINANSFESEWSSSISKEIIESHIQYINGDAVEPQSPPVVISHVVNNLGKWGKGFVTSLSKKYPSSKDQYLLWSKSETFNLGEVQFIEVDSIQKVFVANMLAQEGIRKSKSEKTQHVSYYHLRDCLRKLSSFLLKNRLSVQMPKIGSGLGGGDWDIIEEIIKEEICRNKIKCTIILL